MVDDASFVRDLIKRTIRQRFPVIETTEAQNGRRAQSLMSRTNFDLILCDWEMPEMSGLELLQLMRQQPQRRYWGVDNRLRQTLNPTRIPKVYSAGTATSRCAGKWQINSLPSPRLLRISKRPS